MIYGYIKTNVSGVWVCDGTKQSRSDSCKSSLAIMGGGNQRTLKVGDIGKEKKKDAGNIGRHWSMLF